VYRTESARRGVPWSIGVVVLVRDKIEDRLVILNPTVSVLCLTGTHFTK
jgi:hypothetical protein